MSKEPKKESQPAEEECSNVKTAREVFEAAPKSSSSLAARVAEMSGIANLDEEMRHSAERIQRLIPPNDRFIQITADIERITKQFDTISASVQAMKSFEFDTQYLDTLRPLDRYKGTFNLDMGLKLKQAEKRLMESFTSKTSVSALSKQVQHSFASIAIAQQASTARYSRLLADASALHIERWTEFIRPIEQHAARLNKSWKLSQNSMDMFNEIRESAKLFGNLHLPVIDAASAAAITRVWGDEGVERQLEVLGIGSEELKDSIEFSTRKDSKSSPVTVGDVLTLLGILLTIIIWWDSQQMEARLTGVFREESENRARQIDALKALITKAVEQQNREERVRFIVLQRPALIRSSPENGSTVAGVAFPNQVVKPLNEAGKWLQVEYYDFPTQRQSIGWALKKYFVRATIPDSTN